MITNPSHSVRQASRISKWFLVFLISFSFSSFAGFVANNYSDYQQPTKTEQVVSKDNSYVHGISLDQVITALFHENSRAKSDLNYALCISLYHERFAAVRLKNLTEQLTHFNSFTPFLPLKTIPEYSDQGPANLFIG